MTQTAQQTLPPGTIIRRMIRGKERFYHQWRENGKTLSRYLKPDEILPLREKIELRKRLQAEKRRQAALPRRGDAPVFSCGVLTGARLAELAASASPLKPRSLLASVQSYLREDRPGRVLLVQGLPQTGKTTLLRHALLSLDGDERDASAYMSLPAGLSAGDFLADLRRIAGGHARNVFIDGFGRAEALRDLAPVLEDTFAATGLRLVLAADQPHALAVSARTQAVSTTFLSYPDFLLGEGGATLDDYLRRGGPGEEQVGEEEKRTLDALNRRILLRVLADAVRRPSVRSSRLGSDLQMLARVLGERLGEGPAPADIARVRALNIVETAEDETFFILPGLRRSLSARLVRGLLADEAAAHLGAAERKIVEETILRLVADRTLADLVLYKTMLQRKNATTGVFRLRFPVGGIDVVVADREELTCELCEVRNETGRSDRQLESLDDADRLDAVEHLYGTIASRTLVYRGRNAWHTSGIAYRNVAGFL